MLLNHVHKPRRVRVPFVSPLHQYERVLFHALRSGRWMNRIPVDEPRPCTSRSDGPPLPPDHYWPSLLPAQPTPPEHEDATQSRIFLERPRDRKFVFGRQLADVAMCSSCSFSPASLLNWGAFAGRFEQYENVLVGLGIHGAVACAKTKFATASKLSSTMRPIIRETLFISPPRLRMSILTPVG